MTSDTNNSTKIHNLPALGDIPQDFMDKPKIKNMNCSLKNTAENI